MHSKLNIKCHTNVVHIYCYILLFLTTLNIHVDKCLMGLKGKSLLVFQKALKAYYKHIIVTTLSYDLLFLMALGIGLYITGEHFKILL